MKIRRLTSLIVLGLILVSRIFGDTFRFKSDTMLGSKATGKEITILSGNAEVQSDDLVLKSDRMELSGEDNRYIDCRGFVEGVDAKKGIHFQTERLRYDRVEKIARLEGDSTLEDKENEVISKARFVEYNDETGISVLQISVRIFKGEMVCRSEYALYRRNEKTLELSGFPVVFKESDEFRADKIRVDLETDDVIMEGAVSGSLKEKEKDGESTGESAADSPETPGESAADSPETPGEPTGESTADSPETPGEPTGEPTADSPEP